MLYVILGVVIGLLLWNKVAHEDISRCHELAICQRQYLFIFPFSIFAWPIISLATLMWEPAGIVALLGIIGVLVILLRMKANGEKLTRRSSTMWLFLQHNIHV